MFSKYISEIIRYLEKTAYRGGLLVSGRYRVSDRFRYILLNTGVSNLRAK